VAIQNNVTFVVDLDALDDPEDLMSDDLGAWEQTKTRTKSYKVTFKNGSPNSARKVNDGSEGSFQVFRRSYVNRSDRSLRKTIVNIVSPDGGNFNLVYVKYVFQGEEHKIKVNPHGNTKSTSTIPYLRTYKSTVKKIKEEIESSRASCIKRAVHKVEEAVGGLQFCRSAGAIPRNEKQASYIKASVHPKVQDPILQITQKMKLESAGEEKFIRSYSLDDDSPKVILFTDDQVDDLVNFCCNDVPGHKSLLYVDVTFLLGPFYVLVTTYKNTTLFSRHANPPESPLMVGPVMLCMLKD
jgi:hypothetical protein